MANTMLRPEDLAAFGAFPDALVDAAVASVRREADWHICPRVTETVTLLVRRGTTGELPLPTRDFPDAPVLVTAVAAGGVPLTGWDQAGGVLLLGGRVRPRTRLQVTLTHGFAVCPPDLLPVIAQRAGAARSPRDSRVSSFSNGVVQMAFRPDGLDPTVAGYTVVGGVA